MREPGLRAANANEANDAGSLDKRHSEEAAEERVGASVKSSIVAQLHCNPRSSE
jgi:hypothetical protein